jgi:Tol biopolymer transport system component
MNVWRVPMDQESGEVLGPAEALTTPSAYSGYISFSRDGRQFMYLHSTQTSNIHRVGFNPIREAIIGSPLPVTQGSRFFTAPSPSPDGQRIAFGSPGKQEDLFLIRADGTGLRNLTDDLYRDRLPRWSPDGKQILFYSNRSGEYQAWTIQPDGSGLRQLTFESGAVLESVWSPDGARIAYFLVNQGCRILDLARP